MPWEVGWASLDRRLARCTDVGYQRDRSARVSGADALQNSQGAIVNRWGVTLMAAAVAVAVPLAGCRKPADGGDVHPATTASTTSDPLDGAPQDWFSFLTWADQALTKVPDPVPLPRKPRMAEPRYDLIRLDERLNDADRVSSWQPVPEQDATLLTLGPFRSDQPADGWQVQSAEVGEGQSRTRVYVRGFNVASEDVGRITLDVQIPSGDYVDVIWSNAGKIRLPLPSNDRSWTLSVTTGGLADWKGPLSELALEFDGGGNATVFVNAIKFIKRVDAFPDPIGRARTALSKETRNAIYAHAHATVRYDNIIVPKHGKLQTGVGLVTDNRDAATGAHTFKIRVEGPSRSAEILDESVSEPDTWRDVSASLEDFAGETVSITLEIEGDGVGLWGNPIIYEPVKDAPVVVFYLIDALAAKHLDRYGYDRKTMPHLTALAGQGAWFSEMFSDSPQTVSSVPDYTFSLPTERHGVYGPSMRAPDQLVSIAEAFRAAGFATASFCTNVNAGPRQNADQGFDHFTDRIAYWWENDADRTVPLEEVMHWVDVHRDRPMYIYIHTAEPHAPYTPPPEFAGRFDTGYRGPINGTFDAHNHGFHTARTPEEIAYVVSLYDEECTYADHRLTIFLDRMRAAGLGERMHILVTADHGEEFLEHGAWTHGSDLYSEVQRVPLMIAGPKITHHGRVDTPAQLHDLMPTLLELFDLPQPYVLEGTSLVPFLVDGSEARRESIAKRTLFASNHAHLRYGVIEATEIEEGRWKLMYRFVNDLVGSGKRPVCFELYDMETDRAEQHDIIDTHRDRARAMIGKLIEYRRAQPPFVASIDAKQLELTPDQLRELQSLGYIGQFDDDK